MYKAVVAAGLVVAAFGATNRDKGKPTLPDATEELEQFSAQIVDMLGQGDVGAFALMQERMFRTAGEGEFKAIHSSLTLLRDSFGAYLGHELVGKQQVNQTFCKLVYAAKLETSAICFVFIFYRPKGDWKLFHWHYDCNGDTPEAFFR